jgi:hypothetical protein
LRGSNPVSRAKIRNMNERIKVIIGVVITVFILAFSIYLSTSITNSLDNLEKEELYYQSLMGKKVIFNDDTLMIIDYSTFKSTLTLDNAVVIDQAVFDKLEVIE